MPRLLAGFLALTVLVAAHADAQSTATTADVDRAWAEALAVLTGTDAAAAAREAASPDPACFGGATIPASDRAAWLRTLAAQWRGRPVVWTITGTRARGLLGPPMPAMTTMCMSFERGAWRYAGFIPGD